MSEIKNEIIFNETEKTILDNSADLSEIGFSGRISKKEIEALSKNKREQLKQTLSTNTELIGLIATINESAMSSKESPKEEVVQSEKKDETVTVSENNGNNTEKSPSGQEMYKLESELRNKGFTDLYILTRALELGYIPTLHDLKFKDPSGKFFGNKWNWIKHKSKYVFEGGFVTNGGINNKLSTSNNQFNDFLKKITLSDIALEKIEIKEIKSRVKKMNKLDSASLDNHFKILERIESAINSGNPIDLNSSMKEYKENFSAEKNFSFKNFLTRYKINTISSGLIHEESNLQTRKVVLDNSISLENKRIKKITLDNNIDNLKNSSKKLKKGDTIKLHTHTDGYYLECKIESVSRDGKNILVDYQEYKKGKISGYKGIKKLLQIDSNSRVVIKNNASMPEYGNLKYFDFEPNSEIRTKISEFKSREQELEKIKLELSKNPPNLSEATKLKNNYEKKYTTKIKSSDLIQDKKNALNREKIEVEKVKKEIIDINNKIEKLKADLPKKLEELEKKAKVDPSKATQYSAEGKKLAEEINSEIIELQKRGVNSISGLKLDEIKQVTRESTGWVKSIEKLNGGYESFISKLEKSRGGKILIGASLVGLVFASKDGIKSVFNEGISKETAKDIGDLAVGFIPIVGGLNDLYIWNRGKDWNGRDLSEKEKWTRLGFGIVGLIPGGGLLVKGGAKLGVKVFKVGETGMKAIRAADVGVESARLVGKTATYSYLGYSLVHDVVIPTYYSLPGIKK